MYESSAELAENKLLILYVLKAIRDPISNTQLTEIVLENNFINYFTLQQYLLELEGSDFIVYKENNDKKLLCLTQKGDNVLTLFKDRISPLKISIVQQYISEKLELIKKELTIHSDYTLDNNDNFLVHLKAVENDGVLMELKLTVPTKKQAILLCNKWKNNPSTIYNSIINMLFSEDS